MSIKFDSISLFWQCTILFALFVCGQAIFWTILCVRLGDAESVVNKQTQFNEILRHSQSTATSLSDYQYAIGDWLAAFKADSDLTEARAKLKQHEEEMVKAVSWLDQNLNEYPQLKEEQHQITAGQKRMCRLVSRALEKAEGLSNKLTGTQFLYAFYQRTNNERMEWQSRVIQILQDEVKIFNKIPSAAAESRVLVFQSIMGTIAFNALFGFIFVWFLKRLKGRTLILVENTKRYLKNEPFLAPVAGNDEFTAVDKSMHQMRESIETAQKERQAFLAVVSHELRTPLASILGSVEMTLMMGKADPAALNELALSENELRGFLSLINDLLDLEKLESGKLKMIKKSIYLETVFSKAIAQVLKAKPDAEDKVILRVETDAELEADSDRLAQAIANLLLNAVEATPDGKKVDIKIEETPGEVTIQIIDEGPGVSADLAPHLFERFRKTNGEIITGMGLPIAKHIVEANGGTIGYKAKEGGGSIFWLRLPTISAE